MAGRYRFDAQYLEEVTLRDGSHAELRLVRRMADRLVRAGDPE